MKKVITLFLLICLSVGLCACADINSVSNALSANYNIETVSIADLSSLGEVFDLNVYDYHIKSAIKATHKDKGTGVVVIECVSEKDAQNLDTSVYSSDLIDFLSSYYGTSYKFMTNHIGTIALIGEQSAAAEAYRAYRDADARSSLVVKVFCVVIASCICGLITWKITSNKGYAGGFGWGFFLNVIGIIIVACKEDAPVYTPPAKTPAGSPPPSYTTGTSAPDGWKCSCGRYNARYMSTCSCGMNKSQLHVAFQPKQTAPTATVVTPVQSQPKAAVEHSAKNEMETIAALKEYKALLDANIITQEEFDAKKAQLMK